MTSDGTLSNNKATYEFELRRRDALISHSDFPIAIIVLVSGAAYYLVSNLTFSDRVWMIIISLCFSSMVFVFLSVVRISLCHIETHHKLLPAPKILDTHRKELIKYFDEDSKLANDKFQNYLSRSYLDAADFNSNSNDIRSNHLFLSKSYLVKSLIPLGVAGFVQIVYNMGINYETACATASSCA